MGSIFSLFSLQLDLPPILDQQLPPVSSSTSEAEFPPQGGSPLAKPSVSLLKVETIKSRNGEVGEEAEVHCSVFYQRKV